MVAARPAAGPASASGVRRWGDEYQDLEAWTAAVELLRPDGDYDRIEIEAKESAYVDDVVRRAKARADRYTQLKWSTTTAARVDFEYLTAKKSPTSKSLLEKLLASWRKIRETGAAPVMELMTNRVLDLEDPLLRLADGRSDLIAARGLRPRTAAAKRLDQMAAHLNCDRDELLDMLDHLILTTGYSVTLATTRARLTMQANGLRSDDEALRAGVSTVALWVRDGRRTIWADNVRAAVTRLGLVEERATAGRWGAAGGLDPVPDYLEQYGELAPVVLHGRHEEIATLRAFCEGPAGYLWWQADPWAGKTALMASFALQPPPGVDVLAFFAIARDATQSDSSAFTEAIINQLSVLLGRPLPVAESATTRAASRRSLLSGAARLAIERGRRLVLLVDGLDEDRGAAAGSGLTSIAASLPRHLPPGLHVVVASRPMSAPPNDVASDHPLRSCPVRTLVPSPYASDIERLAQAELAEQLVDPLKANVLALITASGGGLAGQDLEALTGIPLYRLDELLRGVFSRTIASRTHYSVDEQPHRSFIFAHETLRETASVQLGGKVLAASRQRLDAWAEAYREAGWPPLTPAYLLRGYFAVLRAQSNYERIGAYATDRLRHQRMLDMTGGDAEALAEIRIAQDMLRQVSPPDLHTLLRIAVRQGELQERNANLPPLLPLAWVRLGRFIRARSLARAIPNDARRAQALAAVSAHAQSATGVARATTLLREAEAAARAAGSPSARAGALGFVAQGARDLGEAAKAESLLNEAVTIARELPDLKERALTLASVASATKAPVTVAELLDEAINAAASVAAPDVRARALADVAIGYFKAAQPDRGQIVLEQAESIELSPSPLIRSASLSAIALALAAGGEIERAEELASQLPDPFYRDQAVTALIDAVADNDPDRALTLARRLQSPFWQAAATTALAHAMFRRGKQDEALQYAELAEQFTRRVENQPRQARHLAELATTLGTVLGDKPRAHTLASEALNRAVGLTDRSSLDWLSGPLASGFAAAGDLTNAERCARTATDDLHEAEALAAAAETLAQVGDLDNAIAFANETSDTNGHRSRALARVARSALSVGQIARARQIALTIAALETRAQALADVAHAQFAAGDPGGARNILSEIAFEGRNPYAEALGLSAITTAVALTDRTRSVEICEQALRRAGELSRHPELRDLALAAVARAFAKVREHERARSVTTSLTSPAERAKTLAELAGIAFANTEPDLGAQLASEAERLIGTIENSRQLVKALACLSSAVAAGGDWNRAEIFAERLAEPQERSSLFSQLAAQAIDADQLGLARRFAAFALTSALPWSPTFSVLARLEPDVLRKFADEAVG